PHGPIRASDRRRERSPRDRERGRGSERRRRSPLRSRGGGPLRIPPGGGGGRERGRRGLPYTTSVRGRWERSDQATGVEASNPSPGRAKSRRAGRDFALTRMD